MTDGRAELQTWYLESLLPKLNRAAESGVAPPAAVLALDEELRVFLELPLAEHEGAAARAG